MARSKKNKNRCEELVGTPRKRCQNMATGPICNGCAGLRHPLSIDEIADGKADRDLVRYNRGCGLVL